MPNDFTGLNRRECLGFWLNENKLTGQGAEVGCAYGWNAGQILSQWHGQKLFMIDPWSKRPKEEYLECTNDQADFEQWYKDCCALAQKYPIVSLVRSTSIEAAPAFFNEQLDWCYIDAAHDYKNVLADLDAWWPKVKNGGLFGGHDFYNRMDNGHYCEVENAIKRWSDEHVLSYLVTPCTSWWIRK